MIKINGVEQTGLTYELNVDVMESDRYACESTGGMAGIIERHNYFAQDKGGELYYYKGGVYKKGADKAISLAVTQLLAHFFRGKGWSTYRTNQVARYVNTSAPPLLDSPELGKINLLNGIYDVSKGKLEPHTPEYRTTVQIPVNYDPEAKCPHWERFIQEVFPDEEGGKDLGYEIPAWLMVPYTRSQKCVVLLGSGANGKSIYSNAIKAFLGHNNCSSIPLQKLGDRFTTVELLGKLANISTDLPNTKIINTSEFKNLVSGDSLQAEYKHGDIFFFHPFARCLFACNELPMSTSDHSDGFYRRLNVIDFEKQFVNDPIKGEQIEKALTQPAELSGLLNKAIEILPRVLRNGITVTESMKNAINEHRKTTDPTAVWLEENTTEDGEAYVEKVELFEAYKASGDKVAAARSNISFGKALKRYRPNVMAKQKVIDGNICWVYQGIRLKNVLDDMDWQSSDFGIDREGEEILG